MSIPSEKIIEEEEIKTLIPKEIVVDESRASRILGYISFFLIVLSFISYALMLLFSKQYGTTGTTGTIGPFLSTVVWMIIILFLIILTIIILTLEYISRVYFLSTIKGKSFSSDAKEHLKVPSSIRIANIIFTSLLILFDIGIFSYFFFFRRNFNNIFFIIIASLTGFNLIAHVLLLIVMILLLKNLKVIFKYE
jgi:uncharacterized membrane protein